LYFHLLTGKAFRYEMIPQDITDGNPKNLLIIKLLQTGPLLLKEKLWYSLRFCKPGFLPVLSPVVLCYRRKVQHLKSYRIWRQCSVRSIAVVLILLCWLSEIGRTRGVTNRGQRGTVAPGHSRRGAQNSLAKNIL